MTKQGSHFFLSIDEATMERCLALEATNPTRKVCHKIVIDSLLALLNKF